MEQANTAIKHRRCDLVIDIERAEYKSGLRQPSRYPCWRMLSDTPLGIVRLVGIRQVNNFLSVEGVLVFGDNESIGKYVIDIVRAHRARVSKVVDLNRRRTKR